MQRQLRRMTHDFIREKLKARFLAGTEQGGGGPEWRRLVGERERLRELGGGSQGCHGGWLLKSRWQQFDAPILLDAPTALLELPFRNQFLN